MEFKLCFFLFVILLKGGVADDRGGFSWVTATAVETQLMKDLFGDYDKRVRPIMLLNETIHASFGITFKSLLQLDEHREVMETSMFMMLAWHDYRLQWNDSQYMDNLNHIIVPAGDVWRPDFVPFTSIDEDVRLMESPIFVVRSGHVKWIPTLHLRSPCTVNLRHFPFDYQVCSIKFQSYIQHGNTLNMTYYGGTPEFAFDVSNYNKNTVWDLVDHRVEIHRKVYKCCKEEYPHAEFTFVFKRNPSYHVQLFVVPGVILGLLVPVTLMIPPDSKERVTLGCIVLLAVLLLQVKLSELLPVSGVPLPLIVVFYTLTMTWTALALLGSAFVLNLHHRGPRRGKVPELIRSIFLRGLKRLVCLGNDNYYLLGDVDPVSMRSLDKNVTAQDRQQTTNLTEMPSGGSAGKSDKELQEISKNLVKLTSRFTLQDNQVVVLNEWRQVALVVDRILFFLFFFVFILGCFIFLG